MQRKNRLSIVSVICIFLSASLAAAAGKNPSTEEVDNALAQGYTAVQKDQQGEAVSRFTEAGNMAKQAGDWQGMIDAGYGLAALGKVEAAQPFFSDAVNASKNSPMGLIAASYALASLPQNMNALSSAGQALDEAFKLVQTDKDPKGAATVAKAYADLKMTDKAAQAQSFANQLVDTGEESTGPKATPPPGWSPIGESIKGPKEVPVAVQQLNRQSADRDIANKMDYIKHSEELDQREADRRAQLAQAYMYYANSGYYGFPGNYFGLNDFGMYGFGQFQISLVNRRNWAISQLSYFSPYGGFLIRTNRRGRF